MTKFVLPGPAFAGQNLILKTVSAGDTWRRMYETRFPDPLGWGKGLNRFSDPTGDKFGVVYLGSSAKVAFVETILRDKADGRGASCIIEMVEIEKRSLASIQATQDLHLVDLTGDGPLIMGVPSDVIGASDQVLSRIWSDAFHSHASQPDGVYYPSRLNEERCIAIYHRSVSKIKSFADPRLIECRAELAKIICDLKLSIV